MKTITLLFLIVLSSLTSSLKAVESFKPSDSQVKGGFKEFFEWKSGYELTSAVRPIWEGDQIEAESVTLLDEGDGIAKGNLLYEPAEILKVTSYDLKRTFQKGKDFEVVGKTLQAVKGSAISQYKKQDLFSDQEPQGGRSQKTLDGKWIVTGAKGFFQNGQILVSYRHSGKWNLPTPVSQGELPKTVALLKEKKPIKILFFGDSITYGASASGQEESAPFLPEWYRLVCQTLANRYQTVVYATNNAIGGKTGKWGVLEAPIRIEREKADLVVIGFGMNDRGGVSPEEYSKNTDVMIAAARQANPEVEIILLQSIMNNPIWQSEKPLYAFRDQLKSKVGPSIALVDMLGVHEYLLSGKKYLDMTANNLNHPNDFLVRVYAQAVLNLF